MASTVWVFNGAGASLPAGVFADEAAAVSWIRINSLSGILTEYPLDTGVYDWAISCGIWEPEKASQRSPEFIGKFSSAYLKHRHFENGKDEADT